LEFLLRGSTDCFFICDFQVNQATTTKPLASIDSGGNLNGNPDKENVVAAPSNLVKTTKVAFSYLLLNF
jgi:hypothetical protein